MKPQNSWMKSPNTLFKANKHLGRLSRSFIFTGGWSELYEVVFRRCVSAPLPGAGAEEMVWMVNGLDACASKNGRFHEIMCCVLLFSVANQLGGADTVLKNGFPWINGQQPIANRFEAHRPTGAVIVLQSTAGCSSFRC